MSQTDQKEPNYTFFTLYFSQKCYNFGLYFDHKLIVLPLEIDHVKQNHRLTPRPMEKRPL